MSIELREPRRRLPTKRPQGHVQVPSALDVEQFNDRCKEIIDDLQNEIDQDLDVFKEEIENEGRNKIQKSSTLINWDTLFDYELGLVDESIKEAADSIKKKIRDYANKELSSFTVVSDLLRAEFDDSVEDMMSEIDTIVSSSRETASEMVDTVKLEMSFDL